MLRVAFAGTPEFAVPALQAIADSSHRVVGVLTQPDRPAGRGRSVQASPVKQWATAHGAPLDQPESLRPADSLRALASWAPDVLVVVAYGLILPPAVLALPRLGCVNIHASLLPRWRGAAPLQRALLAGDPETGVTLMLMDAGLDTGPMLAQRRLTLPAAATTAWLHDRLAHMGAELLIEVLAQGEEGRWRAVPQADVGITYAAKIDKAEAQIDWTHSALQIDRQVRAFNPWPVAATAWQGRQLRIWHAGVIEPREAALAAGTAPGTAPAGSVLGFDGERILVQCGQGVLGIDQLQMAGRRSMAAQQFIAGNRQLLDAGQRLSTADST